MKLIDLLGELLSRATAGMQSDASNVEIKFTISIVNVSKSILEKIKFKKFFSEHFYDLEFESNKTNDFKITRNSVECPLNKLNPGEKGCL